MTPEQLIIRVESALHRAGRDETSLASQWRECCRRWGPESGAARGVLLELVREANNDEYAQAIYTVGGWRMCGRLDYAGLYGYPAEAEVLLAALEAGR